jgi:hypothetical protein
MFALSEGGANELLKAAALTAGKKPAIEMEQFQVLVKVRLERGNEVLGASLVAVHKITPAGSQGGAKQSSQAQSQ